MIGVAILLAGLLGFLLHSAFYALVSGLDLAVETLEPEDLDDLSATAPARGVSRTIAVQMLLAGGLAVLLQLQPERTWRDGLLLALVAWAFFVTPTIVEVVGTVRRRPFAPIVDSFAWLVALLGQGISLGAIL